MLISKVLDIFIKEEITRGSTDATIRHYRTHINFFIKFYGDKDINTITYNVYQDYINYLRDKYKESSGFVGRKEKLSTRTIKTYASALKTFLSYSYQNKFLDNNISLNIKLPKYKKKVIKILKLEQIKVLLNSLDKDTYTGCRDLLIISLMLESGLRLSEVIKIKLIDIDINKNLIKVDGKGQKERIVPLTAFTKDCFKLYKYKYFLTFGKVITNNEQLIKTHTGENASKNTISLIFRRIRKNIGFDIHPHLLRHTFATMFLLNGGDIANLQIILGHTTLNMVLNYLHLANQINISNQSVYSPLSSSSITV